MEIGSSSNPASRCGTADGAEIGFDVAERRLDGRSPTSSLR